MKANKFKDALNLHLGTGNQRPEPGRGPHRMETADPHLEKNLCQRRSFRALLHDGRFLGVRELRCFHANPPCPAKDN